MASKTQMVTGYIIAVQEQRFRLLTDKGQSLLLTLGNGASGKSSDLHRWHTANIPVRVTYEGRPNLISGVAHTVKPVVSTG